MARAPQTCTNCPGTRLGHFGAARETSLGRIATPRGTCRSRAPRRGKWNLGIDSRLVRPSLYGSGRGRVSIARLANPPSRCTPRHSARHTAGPNRGHGCHARSRPTKTACGGDPRSQRGRPAAGSRRRTPSYKFTSTYFMLLHASGRDFRKESRSRCQSRPELDPPRIANCPRCSKHRFSLGAPR